MAIINTLLKESTLNTYNRYIKQKAKTLEKINNTLIEQELNSISQLNKDIGITEEELANRALAKLKSLNFEKGFSTIVSDLQRYGNQTKKFFQSQGFSDLVKIQSGLVDGHSYKMQAGKLNTLVQAANQGVSKKGTLYNLIGDTGETIAELQGTAIASTLIEELKNKIANNGGKNITANISGKQLGTKNLPNFGRSLADTGFEITLNWITNNGYPTEATYSFLLSDKMSIAKPGKQTIVYRRGTIASLATEAQKEIYNLMSWHIDRDTGEIINYYFDINNDEVKNYLGQKLLNNFLTVQKNQQVNFQVFNGQIISTKQSLKNLIVNDIRYSTIVQDYPNKIITLDSIEQEKIIKTRSAILRKQF